MSTVREKERKILQQKREEYLKDHENQNKPKVVNKKVGGKKSKK